MNFTDHLANQAQSIRLKALGFNEPTLTWSNLHVEDEPPLRIEIQPQEPTGYPSRTDFVIRPLYTQVWDWTLKNHDLYVEIFPIEIAAGETTGYRWQWSILDLNPKKNPMISDGETDSLLGYLTRSAASNRALDHLITILDNRNPEK